MQNLSSIHRASSEFQRAQGFGPWPLESKMLKIRRKVTSADEHLPPTMQNRFAHVKLALRGIPHMTRRDGLSSRESNILCGSGEI